jgi:hypothetical protein
VPFNDLSIQWRAIADDIQVDFERIFADSAYCLGPACEAFEEEIAGCSVRVTQSASPRAPRRCMLPQSLRVSVQAMKCWFPQTSSSGLYGE